MLRVVTAVASRLAPYAAQGTASISAAALARAAPSALRFTACAAHRNSVPISAISSGSSHWQSISAAALGAGLAGYASVGSAQCAGEEERPTVTVVLNKGGVLSEPRHFYASNTAGDLMLTLQRAGYTGELLDKNKVTLTDKDKLVAHDAYELRIPPQPGQPYQHNVLEYLCTKYGQQLLAIHKEPPPGPEREGRLDSKLKLSDHMPLVGRDPSYLIYLAALARIFRRRLEHDITASSEFRRGLAYILLLSCPGSGKTTFLLNLPDWVRRWFDATDAKDRRNFVAWAMYPNRRPAEDRPLVSEFLQALQRVVGPPHLLAVLRPTDSPQLKNADVENMKKLRLANACAARLLFAYLTPLARSAALSYSAFLHDMDQDVLERLDVPAVVACVRRVFGLADGEYALLPLLIDEGNLATGCFGTYQQQDVTWLKELLTHLIDQMNSGDDRLKRTVLVSTVATTAWQSVDLAQFTLSGQAKAVNVPLPILTVPDRKKVIRSLAQYVAQACGRSLDVKVSTALDDWLLELIGGGPRMLGLLLERLGGDSWSTCFDEVVQNLEVHRILSLCTSVHEAALGGQFWERFMRGSLQTQSAARKKQVLAHLLAIILLDLPVRQTDCVVADLDLTIERLAFFGLIEMTPLVGNQAPIRVLATDELPVRPASPAAQDSPSASSSAAAEPPATPAATLHAPGQLLELDQGPEHAKRPKQQEEDEAVCSPDCTPYSACTSICGPTGARVMLHDRLASPTDDAISVQHVLCPPATSTPGSDLVQIGMAPLVLVQLFRNVGLVRNHDLSCFSDQVQRERALDKETVDGMAVALKLEACALLNLRTVQLQDLFRGLTIPAGLAGRTFLVPQGQLSLGDGRRLGDRLLGVDRQQAVDKIAQDILNSVEPHSSRTKQLSIGIVFTGDYGSDTMVVLVDAKTRRPCPLVIQSKQDTSARQQYDTLPKILQSMESDCARAHQLPTLPEAWQEWHQPGSAALQDRVVDSASKFQRQPAVGQLPTVEFPETEAAQAQSDDFVYAFVSDHLWSAKQDELYAELLRRRHPWVARLLVVSRSTQDAWYGRIGAFRRKAVRAVMSSKLRSADTTGQLEHVAGGLAQLRLNDGSAGSQQGAGTGQARGGGSARRTTKHKKRARK